MKAIIKFSLLMVLLTSCATKPKDPEIFSPEKPLTVEIKKERSYFQAEKIANRLNKMGVEAYILAEKTGEGEWYRVVSGALENDSIVANYKHLLDSTFNIKKVKVLDFQELDSVARIPIVRDSIKNEVHRITANEPKIPQEIKDVIKKFPDNGMFYLKAINMVTLNQSGLKQAGDMKLDLPRGLSLRRFEKIGCNAFAEVVYTDNLYGDNVTLQIFRKPRLLTESSVMQASFIPIATANNSDELEFCSSCADAILETGNYENEEKDGIEVKAYTKLQGYTASFDTKGKKRTYYIMTDEAGEYIYVAQSTKDENGEVLDFMSEIGNSDGLVEYDEFYNSFYTVADNPLEGDEFIGYSTEKLTWNYAKSKGYQMWAKKMVGHWCTHLYFYNPNKGVWSYMLTDLLTKESEYYQYNLYYNDMSADSRRIIYGEKGCAVSHYNWYTGCYELSEINFPYKRFNVAASAAYNNKHNFSERDLIQRAERLQFMCGGYQPNIEEN